MEVSEVRAARRDADGLADEGAVISAEMQAVIAAAAVACAGRGARVRGLTLVGTSHASAWSQQGRMLVQSSHNVRAKA
jgi:hypothetical protein